MGRCPDARALLPAYVEDELTAAEQTRVKGHLEICSACRKEEVAFRMALGALAVAPKPAHGDLYAGLSARLDQLEHRPVFRPRQLRWAGALACLLLAVGVGATVAGRTYFTSHPPKPEVVTGIRPTPVFTADRKPGSDQVKPSDPAPFEPEVIPPSKDEMAPSYEDPKYTAGDPPPTIREERQRRQSADRRNRSEEQDAKDFKGIRDQYGRNVHDLENQLRRQGRASSGGDFVDAPPRDTGNPYNQAEVERKDLPARPVNLPEAPNVKVVVPEQEKSQKVGESYVRVHRETGYDSEGQLALIRIRLNAEPAPKGDGGKSGTQHRKGATGEEN